jgi:hypothetical protein
MLACGSSWARLWRAALDHVATRFRRWRRPSHATWVCVLKQPPPRRESNLRGAPGGSRTCAVPPAGVEPARCPRRESNLRGAPGRTPHRWEPASWWSTVPSILVARSVQGSSSQPVVELSHHDSNHLAQMNALVRTLGLVRAQPTSTNGASVSAAFRHGAPTAAARAEVDPRVVATHYLGGSTLIELADLFGVSTSTIKHVLRDEGGGSTGARRDRRFPSRWCLRQVPHRWERVS